MRNQYEQVIGPFPKELMEGAEPFFFPGGAVGCLMVHGLTSHPGEMREFGECLAGRGLTVLGIALPGHGTTPEALAKTTWMEWDEAVFRGYQTLAKHSRYVAAVGSSTGGTLALHLSLNAPLIAVAAMAPPVFDLADPRFRWASWVKYLMKFSPKKGRSVNNPDVKTALYGYDVNPVASVEQLARCMNHMKTCLREVKVPVLLWHGERDPVVPISNSERLMVSLGSPQKIFHRLANSSHMIALDYEKQTVFDQTHAFILEHAGLAPDPS